MAREKFLLVSLEEQQAKQLADVISNDTSRRIINHLSEKEDTTETELSKTLGIPLSTVHYNLQKLTEAGLVNAETFHYSSKGREVDHYRLANKYIIITPKPIKGIRTHLKNILPVAFAILGISWILKLMQGSMYAAQTFAPNIFETMPSIAQKTVASSPTVIPAPLDYSDDIDVQMDIATTASQGVGTGFNQYLRENATYVTQTIYQEPNIALWFFIGGMAALFLCLLVSVVRKRLL